MIFGIKFIIVHNFGYKVDYTIVTKNINQPDRVILAGAQVESMEKRKGRHIMKEVVGH